MQLFKRPTVVSEGPRNESRTLSNIMAFFLEELCGECIVPNRRCHFVYHRNLILLRALGSTACGVCHSDLHVINKDQPYPIPCVLGHEITGEVVEHGKHTDPATVQRLSLSLWFQIPRGFLQELFLSSESQDQYESLKAKCEM